MKKALFAALRIRITVPAAVKLGMRRPTT